MSVIISTYYILLVVERNGGLLPADTGLCGKGGASPGDGVDCGLGVWSMYGTSGEVGAVFILCP